MSKFTIFSIIIFTTFISTTFCTKICAQTFAFNLQNSSLSFDYTTEANFTTPRVIPRAFTVSVTNSRRGKYNVYCKIIANSNTYTDDAPSNLFSIKVNNANFTVASSYYQNRLLGLTDVLITNVSNRVSRSDVIYYDLILNPLDLNVNPSMYNYSFVFTVSEY